MSENEIQMTGVLSVPRWKLFAATGMGCRYEDLTKEERRLAREYICTDQYPEMLVAIKSMFERLGREARERIDAAAFKAIGG